MTDYYSPGQLSVIYPYLREPPKWLLLGGPADANEAQTAVERWPGVRVLGVEPNREAHEWQLAHGWPPGHPLIHAALGDREGAATISSPSGHLRSSSLDPERFDCGPESRLVEVPTVTLDNLDRLYGPFEEAVLWMDIEGWELEALRGAAGLLARGAIRLVNAEMQERLRRKNDELEAILHGHGFRAVKDWNDSPECRDRIFVRG